MVITVMLLDNGHTSRVILLINLNESILLSQLLSNELDHKLSSVLLQLQLPQTNPVDLHWGTVITSAE